MGLNALKINISLKSLRFFFKRAIIASTKQTLHVLFSGLCKISCAHTFPSFTCVYLNVDTHSISNDKNLFIMLVCRFQSTNIVFING